MIAYVVPNITMAGYGRIKDISPSIGINKISCCYCFVWFRYGFFLAPLSTIFQHAVINMLTSHLTRDHLRNDEAVAIQKTRHLTRTFYNDFHI